MVPQDRTDLATIVANSSAGTVGAVVRAAAGASAGSGGGRTVEATPSRWAGMPVEERRARRRRLLLDAALELLGEGGREAVTVRAVCERARLNPRYFYESFPDRDELLVGLYDDVGAELAGRVAAALAAATDDLAAAVRAGVETVFRFVADDPRRAAILYTEAVDLDALARRRQAATDALIAAITAPAEAGAAAGMARVPAVEPIDVVAASMFTGGVNEILVGWLGGRIQGTLEHVVDDAVTLSLAVFDARR